jgi:hypothetical protein
MARVYPTQVVAFIERMFPDGMQQSPEKIRTWRFGHTYAEQLAALIEMVDQIPPELMPAEASKYFELTASRATIREVLETWRSRGGVGTLDHISALGDLHPVGLIHRALFGLPDALPSSDTVTLQFLCDPDFELSLRTDISTASSALRNSEWKAATVLAGSVIEALLFWELKQHPQGEVRKLAIRKDDLDRWHLPQYIEAAGKFECVGKDTITGAQMAKDYRNLIHPGASERTGQVCDLGSAHHAVAALDHVVRDLTKQICPRHK